MTKKRVGSKRSRRMQEMLNSVLVGRSFRCEPMSGERVKSECDTDLYVIRVRHQKILDTPVVVAEGGRWYVSTTAIRKNAAGTRVLSKFIRELAKISPVQYQEPNELGVIATHGITGVALGLHKKRDRVYDLGKHMDTIDHMRFERQAKEYR